MKGIKEPMKVAVMGCSVNGPGEAKQAVFGIAGGRGHGVVFAKGRIVKTVKENDLVSSLIKEIRRFAC